MRVLEDRLIPLSIGGNPRDPKNLWPEPRFGLWLAARKDDLEYALYKKLCAGKITLKVAQDAFRDDWVAAYKKYVTPRQRKNSGAQVRQMLLNERRYLHVRSPKSFTAGGSAN